MKKLIAIGEALIDFIPHQTGVPLKDVDDFKGIVGGAPANVCGAFAKLGGKASLISQLGFDAFGDKIIDELNRISVDTQMISRTDEANTCLAFVSLKDDGDRDFSFYRNPSADMLLEPEKVKPEYFKDLFALHFCSVSLGDYPMKEAHKKAIKMALDEGAMISFDPNIRLPLWEDHKALKRVVNEFIPYAHILKISDEELSFITGCDAIEDVKDSLFLGNVKLIIYTKGAGGAEAYTKNEFAEAVSRKVKAIDTTGAGDAFIGSFLSKLCNMGIDVDSIDSLSREDLTELLSFSNLYCEYSIQRNGATASYATKEQISEHL